MSVRGFPPKYRFLTPGHLRLAHQISKVGENLAHLNTRKKWFACHVQIAGRRTNEEEDESEENGVRQVGPRIGAWACARDAPSFLSVVARHTRPFVQAPTTSRAPFSNSLCLPQLYITRSSGFVRIEAGRTSLFPHTQL